MAGKQGFESYAKSIFDEFDADQNGFIDVKEFEEALKKLNKTANRQLTDEQIKQEATVG